MSYKTQTNSIEDGFAKVIEDCHISDNSPYHKHIARHKVPNDLTVTFSCRGTFEVIITDGHYIVEKVKQ